MPLNAHPFSIANVDFRPIDLTLDPDVEDLVERTPRGGVYETKAARTAVALRGHTFITPDGALFATRHRRSVFELVVDDGALKLAREHRIEYNAVSVSSVREGRDVQTLVLDPKASETFVRALVSGVGRRMSDRDASLSRALDLARSPPRAAATPTAITPNRDKRRVFAPAAPPPPEVTREFVTPEDSHVSDRIYDVLALQWVKESTTRVRKVADRRLEGLLVGDTDLAQASGPSDEVVQAILDVPRVGRPRVYLDFSLVFSGEDFFLIAGSYSLYALAGSGTGHTDLSIGPGDAFVAAAVSPNQRVLAVGGRRTLRFFDVPSFIEIGRVVPSCERFGAHTCSIASLQFLDNARLIAVTVDARLCDARSACSVVELFTIGETITREEQILRGGAPAQDLDAYYAQRICIDDGGIRTCDPAAGPLFPHFELARPTEPGPVLDHVLDFRHLIGPLFLATARTTRGYLHTVFEDLAPVAAFHSIMRFSAHGGGLASTQDGSYCVAFSSSRRTGMTLAPNRAVLIEHLDPRDARRRDLVGQFWSALELREHWRAEIATLKPKLAQARDRLVAASETHRQATLTLSMIHLRLNERKPPTVHVMEAASKNERGAYDALTSASEAVDKLRVEFNAAEAKFEIVEAQVDELAMELGHARDRL